MPFGESGFMGSDFNIPGRGEEKGEDRSDQKFLPSYEIREKSDIQKEVSQFLERHSINPANPKPSGIYLIDGQSKYSNLSRSVESSVFYEKFENTANQLDEEYGAYENSSQFITAIDQQEKLPEGVVRVIKNSEVGLKSLVDIENEWNIPIDKICGTYGLDLDRTWDIGALAVAPEYRGTKEHRKTSLSLYYSLCKHSVNNDIKNWVAVIDDTVLRYLKHIGFDYHPIAESKYYLGSDASTPIIVDVTRLKDSFKEKSEYYFQKIINGKDLDQVVDFSPDMKPQS